MSDKLETLKSNRDQITRSLEAAEMLFKTVDAVVKTNKEENTGWVLAKTTLDDTRATVDKLNKQIEEEEQTAAAAAIIEPLVKAFGTVSVKDGTNIPASFHLVDVDKLINDAQALVDRGNDRLTIFRKFKDASGKAVAEMPEGFTIERPIHFAVEGNQVKITVASRGGARKSGDGEARTRSSGKVQRITASPNRPGLVGKTIGSKESDYESWREFMSREDADEFKRLDGAPGNFSARAVAMRRLKLETEEVVTPATAA